MNKSEKIRLYYGIFLSVLTAAVGIVFIIQIADLYYSGTSEGLDIIYTIDRISERLTLPLVFLGVWIAAIIAGFILSVVFPIAEKRKPYVDNKKILGLLKSRVPTSGTNEEFDIARKGMKKHEIARICVWCATSAVLLVSAIFILAYVLDPSHFSKATMAQDILDLVKNIIIWVCISIACSIAAIVFEGISLKREVAYVKKAIATGDKKSAPQPKKPREVIVTLSAVAMGILIALTIGLFIATPPVVTAALNGFTQAWQYILLASLIAVFVVTGLIIAKAIKKYVPEKATKIFILCSRIAIGVVAVVFIVVGILNDGAQDVLAKAIAICTECIGLG